MGHYLEAACKRKFWSRYLGNNSSARPSIINVIEAARLYAFAPPSSSLDRHCVVVFARNMNNPWYQVDENADYRLLKKISEARRLSALFDGAQGDRLGISNANH